MEELSFKHLDEEICQNILKYLYTGHYALFHISSYHVSVCLYIYIYTGSLDIRVRHSATPRPPHSHTSDRPIFKIPFDYANLGKLIWDSLSIFVIFAL